jgi:hypothetical protein
MSFRPSPIARYLCTGLSLFLALPSFALTLQDLRNQEKLTPAEFAHHFRSFQFSFRKEVQRPEVFLATRSGDCDDFSTLAAAVLRHYGYTPRLISVRMPGVTHVICYIEETNSYLDYNNRSAGNFLVPCGNTLAEMAESVARSYRLKWTSASEFTFEKRQKRLVKTIFEPRRESKFFASLFR